MEHVLIGAAGGFVYIGLRVLEQKRKNKLEAPRFDAYMIISFLFYPLIGALLVYVVSPQEKFGALYTGFTSPLAFRSMLISFGEKKVKLKDGAQ